MAMGAPPWVVGVCMAMGAPWVTGACMAMIDPMVLALAALTPTSTAGTAVAAVGPAKIEKSLD